MVLHSLSHHVYVTNCHLGRARVMMKRNRSSGCEGTVMPGNRNRHWPKPTSSLCRSGVFSCQPLCLLGWNNVVWLGGRVFVTRKNVSICAQEWLFHPFWCPTVSNWLHNLKGEVYMWQKPREVSNKFLFQGNEKTLGILMVQVDSLGTCGVLWAAAD